MSSHGSRPVDHGAHPRRRLVAGVAVLDAGGQGHERSSEHALGVQRHARHAQPDRRARPVRQRTADSRHGAAEYAGTRQEHRAGDDGRRRRSCGTRAGALGDGIKGRSVAPAAPGCDRCDGSLLRPVRRQGRRSDLQGSALRKLSERHERRAARADTSDERSEEGAGPAEHSDRPRSSEAREPLDCCSVARQGVQRQRESAQGVRHHCQLDRHCAEGADHRDDSAHQGCRDACC